MTICMWDWKLRLMHEAQRIVELCNFAAHACEGDLGPHWSFNTSLMECTRYSDWAGHPAKCLAAGQGVCGLYPGLGYVSLRLRSHI